MLALLGALYLELSTLKECLVSLQIRPVSVAPDQTAVVVDVSWRADGQHERGRLDVVEFLDVFSKYVDQVVRYAG